MKKVLAISGGVDSMLLLWMFRDDPDAVVAHFDHGTRPSSRDDAEFVQRTANNYGMECYIDHGNLGENVSEAKARQARYQFLEEVAKDVQGGTSECHIYTAHHLNDLAESVAINFVRGTGWRGLTPFSNTKIIRPLLKMTKCEILVEAAKFGIIFRQDPTNVENNYLRNVIREKIATMPKEQLCHLLALYKKQVALRTEAESIEDSFLDSTLDNLNTHKFMRSWFRDLDEQTAMDILRAALKRINISATRPQLQDFLYAIKNYTSHKKFNLPNDHLVTLYKDYFML